MDYRSDDAAWRSAWTAGLILLASLLLAPTAAAQQTPSSCAPVSRHGGRGVLVPSFPDASTNPKLAASLTLGYRQLYQQHLYGPAAATLDRALTAATAAANPCAQALALYALGSNAESNNFKDALNLYDRALKLFTAINSPAGIAKSHFELGSIHSIKHETTAAVTELGLSASGFQAIGDTVSALNARVEAAYLQPPTDYPGLLAEAHADHFPCIEAQIQNLWSSQFNSANNFDEAMQHEVAADSLLTQCPEDSGMRATVQTSMGRMERQQGRPAFALQHYRIALRLQLQSRDLELVPQTYNAMAIAYDETKDWNHSLPLYRRGLAVAEQIHSQPYIDFLEANLGNAYTWSGQPKRGIPLLERASSHLTSDYLRCIRLGQLGSAYARAGDDRGILTLQTALGICRTQKMSAFILHDEEELARAELARNHLEQAVEYAHQALPLVEETRTHLVQKDAYKQGFVDEEEELYDTAIAALTALQRPGEALEVAEQSRARALLDLLASRQAVPTSTVTQPPAEQTRSDLIASPTHIASLTTGAMLDTIARLHSTLIAYWSAPTALYIWIARPGEPVVEVTQPVSKTRLDRLVALSHHPPPLTGTASTNARTLYRLLIAPIETHLPTGDGDLLTIVPSGSLFALSFSALMAPDGHCLEERFRTHTIPSVGLLAFTHRNAEAAVALAPHTLFIANPSHFPVAADGHPLPPLPASAKEVDAIARKLPPDEVTTLEGRNATTAQLIDNLPHATILHFATHAVLNEATPYDSFLALDATNRNGKLTIADIYALHVTTRLVVLSACRTGLGKISGDGVDGMSRAFFYAGSASVLTTLGDIADSPAALLMPRFYAALQQGKSPSEALRSAQLSMLADLRAGRITVETLAGPRKLPPSPAYWAAFSLAGEP